MATTIKRDIVLDALYNADLDDHNLYEKYSGRAMYGAECFGITGSIGDMIRFIAALARTEALDEDGREYADQLANAVRTDNMGLDMIYYFPGFELEEKTS